MAELKYEKTSNVRYNSDESQFAANGDRTLIDHTQQSIDVGDGVRRHPKSTSKLIFRLNNDITTIYDATKYAAKLHADKPCFGHRPADSNGKVSNTFKFITYSQAYDRMKHIAAGLRHLGVSSGAHVGIYSKNRIEWQLASEACHMQSMVSISFYDSLGKDSSLYILNHGEISTIFVSGECLGKVIDLVHEAKFLKLLVCFDPFTDEQKAKVEQHGMQMISLQEVEKYGAENPIDDVPPTPDTLSTIMYTSGTTGAPKGVMITHRNMVAAVAGIAHNVPRLQYGDRFLSYLPLAHILERVAEALLMFLGCQIGYWQGDIKLLREDIVAMKPTLLACVPRVLDRFYDAIRSKALDPSSSWVKRWMFEKAFAAKKQSRRTGGSTPVWDWLVFSKLKAITGGDVKLILSGGAPLRPEVQEFLSIAFDLPLVQGYGLTETCAATTIQLENDYAVARAGAIVPSVEIKLVDVPELNYFSKNNEGEVWIRGPPVSVGYYKEPEKTREDYDDEGWFHTGDIGRWNKDGSLSVIDRKKNMFKLAQGEYVAVEHLELQLSKCDYASRIWIYGDSFKTALVAVISVEPANIVNLAKELGVANASESNLAELCENEKIIAAVQKSLDAIAKEAKFQGYEYVRKITLIPKPFEEYEGCSTPSMKLVRNVCLQVFKSEIDAMYSALG